jgi:hypothetical protein
MFKNNIIFKILRFITGYKTIQFNLEQNTNSVSVSDLFCFRTDNNFKTIFRYTDLLNLFYNIKESQISLKFYDNNYNLIKTIWINLSKISGELIITKDFLNGFEGYGVFCIFHKTEKKIENVILSNRCYLGFSYKNNNYSFVHGNTLANHENITSNNTNLKLKIIRTSLFANQIYNIQNYFSNLDKSELFITNPTYKLIKIFVNKEKFQLNKGESIIINTTKYNQVKIKSNCNFLRPIIFNYSNNFLDVYHG